MKSSLLIFSVVVQLINVELKLSSLVLDEGHQLVDDVGSHGLELCIHFIKIITFERKFEVLIIFLMGD